MKFTKIGIHMDSTYVHTLQLFFVHIYMAHIQNLEKVNFPYCKLQGFIGNRFKQTRYDRPNCPDLVKMLFYIFCIAANFKILTTYLHTIQRGCVICSF